jgi:probable addiction module antidote protein
MARRIRKTKDVAVSLSEALARGDATSFTAGLMEIIKERGMTSMARQTGVSRHTLYRYEWGTDRPLLETALKMTAECFLSRLYLLVQFFGFRRDYGYEV